MFKSCTRQIFVATGVVCIASALAACSSPAPTAAAPPPAAPRIGAVTMAEGAYLLKVRRPFAPPGDLNNSTGPDAVELSPDQIAAKVEKDPVEWNARIEALRNVGLEVLEIVKRRNAQELWDASENLDAACEGCHRSYWYPGETPEFYQRLQRRLEERTRPSAKTATTRPK
jgi:hypothetical protein